jgi:hypothetical protein
MMDKGAARAFARLQTALGAEPKRRNSLPALALSVRQPWAWAIVHAGKDVENRSWSRVPKSWRERRGPVAIHAARGMTRREYEDARRFMERLGVEVPPAHELRRGGIIGSVKVVAVVNEFHPPNPWFVGPLGFVLRDPKPCQFVPAIGRLGYFPWQPSPADSIPKTPRWMFAGRQLDMMEWLDTH